MGRELPLLVVYDELQHPASGCYAAHSGVKRWNRQAENSDGRGWMPCPERRLFCCNKALVAIRLAEEVLVRDQT